MDIVKSFLVDWAIRFLQNKDAIRKEIISIEKDNSSDFIIHYKARQAYFIIIPLLENGIFDRIKTDNSYGIFTLNNPSNIRFIVTEWGKLVNFKFLRLYFINPFSSADRVWAISPYVHDKVCDKSSLENGLNSMAGMVSQTGPEELSNRIRLLKSESAQQNRLLSEP